MKAIIYFYLSLFWVQYTCEDYCEIVGAGMSSTNVELEQYEDCEVAGVLSIIQTDITDLKYLHNLRRVNKYLKIAHNGSLRTLTGLDNLEYVGAAVYIYHNDILQSLEGLGKLKSVGKDCNEKKSLDSGGPPCELQIKFNEIQDFKGLKSLDYSYIPIKLHEKSYEGMEHFYGVKKNKFSDFLIITAYNFKKSVSPFINLKLGTFSVWPCNEDIYHFEYGDELKGNYDYVQDILLFKEQLEKKRPELTVYVIDDPKEFCSDIYEPCGECQ